jgi:Amt family ammonium transporter
MPFANIPAESIRTTLASLIEQIHDAILVIGPEGRIDAANAAACTLFGLDVQDIPGVSLQRLFTDHSRLLDRLRRNREVEAQACPRRRKPIQVSVRTADSGGDEQTYRVLIVHDTSSQHQVEESLHREKEFAQITLQAIEEAVITTDERGRINSANGAACTLLRREHEQVMDRPLRDLLTFSELDHRRALRDGLQRTLKEGHTCSMDGQPELRFNDGSSIYVGGRLAPLRARDGSIIGAILVLRDVTREKRMKELLSYQATHDELTDLINRREFERRLEALLHDRSPHSRHVLLYLDLDQFKLINDNCGHNAGDQMLRQLTGLLGNQLRQADTLARLGGDEFAVLLPHCEAAAGQQIAEALREIIRDFRFTWNGRTFGVGVSIGLVQIDDGMDNTAEVMAAADSACYLAKEHGRDQVVVHQPDGNEETERRNQIWQAAQIRECLEQQRFRLWAQPILPIGTEDFHWGVEILVRMLDEEGQLVPPGLFIPAAERYNLMGHIDTWVVENLGQHWTRHPEVFDRMQKVAINLSGQSIANDEFLEHLITVVDQNGLPWEKLCFEVTETAAVSSIERARHFIETLKQRGADFSLDDFGSGLSSFGYLKNLPVDFLKIDGAFVKDMLTDQVDAAMVRSIADIGRTMGLRTIAEFVENEALVEILRDARVDYVQGYGICKPMSIEALADYCPEPLGPRTRLSLAAP